MRIITLSDLCWDIHLRHMTMDEVSIMDKERVAIYRYAKIKKYYDLIINEKADLVLFAGDITGDGSCGHGYHLAFLSLLTLLEKQAIPSCFIAGNHDPDIYYTQLLEASKSLKYTQEISQKLVEVVGIKILGVNYNTSKRKRDLKLMLNEHQAHSVDIVLAHSQTKRRIYHFDFDCQYIITGHYDRKLLSHRGKILVALDNDSEEISYSVINKTEQEESVAIKIWQTANITFEYREHTNSLQKGLRSNVLLVNNKPAFDLLKLENASDESLSRDGDHYLYLKYLRGINYACSLDTMYKEKNGIALDEFDLTINQIHRLPITASYQISESMIEDYLGNVID